MGSEQQALQYILNEVVVEQRRKRRWGIFFKLAILLWLFFFLFTLGSLASVNRDVHGPHTALIDLDGIIANDAPANAANIVESLDRAFESSEAKGVILRINSPGGSPTQSAIINAEIVRLKKLHPNTPFYVVAEDICASGGYYVAAAADKIYVNKSSLVGSIGVLMNGFGFTEAMKKLGIERRLMTSGKDKGFLDPFTPRNPEHEKFVQKLLDEVHQQFIDVVKAGRGSRLKASDDVLFSGLAWTGEESVKLGLADDFGSVNDVARDVIKAEKIRDYTQHEPWFNRVARTVGASFGHAVSEKIGFGWSY